MAWHWHSASDEQKYTKGISFCQSCFESISFLILYLLVCSTSYSLWVLAGFLQALFLRAGHGMGDHTDNAPNVHRLAQLINTTLF